MATLSCYVLAALFVSTGLLHFIMPQTFVRIVPPYLPRPLLLVYISGVFEIAGGAGLLVSTWRPLAGWGLILLLIAVFPANVHMALHPAAFRPIPAWALYLRLPLQVVLIAWVYAAAVA
ncbi:DoxX family protein [Salisaeta longa]|uniref:DoxX family protein n=1 Tax=Salisaeta longa TaxID=503170 RepID=UPI00040EA572|nr:DoxX family membrane protein [Salisaeta longa]